MKIRTRIVNQPFRYPFTIARGTKTHQPIFIVQMEWNGFYGYGEAPEITYYNIPAEKMQEDLDRKKLFAEKFALTDPERYWHYLHHLFPQNAFLVCALDMAGWDLFGNIRGKSISELISSASSEAPVTDYTIGIDTVEKMKDKMLEKPWPVYKIKVGFEGDMEMIRSLRKITGSKLRVDVNSGWTSDQALRNIQELKDLDIELVEQPLHKDDWEGMKKLFKESTLPLIADESCVSENDVDKCQGYFHGINIKLTKCSGITPARRMITRARELDLKIMLGCMNETTIGTAAMVHLAPFVDFLDADGPLLLKEDLATGITYLPSGHILPSGKPGLGISLIHPF